MIANLRLASGFVLFVFVLGHFSNHALGLVSLSFMNDMLAYTVSPWRTLPGTILILGSLTLHAILALHALYERGTLQMKSWEFFQLVSGFAIPLLLSAHVLSTRGAYEAFGLEEGYAFQLYVQWVQFPYRSFMIFTGLILVWIHACIGWHYWLRYKRWYNRFLPVIFALSVLLPTLAIAGILSAGFRVLRLSGNENWVNGLMRKVRSKGEAFSGFIDTYEQLIIASVIVCVLGIIALKIALRIWKYRSQTIRLTYKSLGLDEPVEIMVPRGKTVLEHLNINRIPHASVCGGRGRCSTCRIRVNDPHANLPPLSQAENKILQRIGAEENVRLACQLPLENDLSVTALLRSDVGSKEALNQYQVKSGEEQPVAILFADIRAFTKLSETQLPYDTAFLLNRYFAITGKAIESSGGHLDKFIGDGVMAIFGIDKSLEQGCREAMIAARQMSRELQKLNTSLIEDIGQPLKIGIGIHSGTAIIGNMGYNKATGLTAIGDVVNTASRLESLTKEYNVEFLVSQKTAALAGLDETIAEKHTTNIKGRVEPLGIITFKSASDIVLKETVPA